MKGAETPRPKVELKPKPATTKVEIKPKAKPETSKGANPKEPKRTYERAEEDPVVKTALEEETAKALKKAQGKAWDTVLKNDPEKVQNYADQGNEDAKAALKRQRRRERYAEKKREAEAANASPLPEELVPDLDEPITFLTPDQIARRDELKAKTTPSTSEQNELNTLTASDPFKQYEKLKERLGKGEVLSSDEQTFAEKFEATEEYKKLKEEEVKKAKEDEAKAIEDATKKHASPESAKALLEVLAAEGVTSKALETQAKVLLEDDTPQSQAMGLDLMQDALVIRHSELVKQLEGSKDPAEKAQLEAQMDANKLEFEENKRQRDKLSQDNPKFSENQWTKFATAITGSADVGEFPIIKIQEHISALASSEQATCDKEFKRWKDAGIMDQASIDAIDKLISDEQAKENEEQVNKKEEQEKERKERIGGKVKKIGLVAALLLALSVWAAAKKAGADNQMGGH